jgi:hypothetical protein
MKDCFEQADRMARRYKLYEGAPWANYTVSGYTNHYSPKFDRCYVEVVVTNHQIKEYPRSPLTERMLYDAFEGRELAICSSKEPTAVVSCQIEGSASTAGDCAACESFVEDHMNH